MQSYVSLSAAKLNKALCVFYNAECMCFLYHKMQQNVLGDGLCPDPLGKLQEYTPLFRRPMFRRPLIPKDRTDTGQPADGRHVLTPNPDLP